MIKLVGADKLLTKLESLEKNTTNIKPILAGVGEMISTETKLNIANQKDPSGKAWTPLRAATIAKYTKSKTKDKKRAQSISAKKKILVDSGALSRIIYSTTANSVTVGTNATAKGFPYPIVHQFGGKHTPQRAFLPIEGDSNAPTLTAKMTKAVLEYIDKKIKE